MNTSTTHPAVTTAVPRDRPTLRFRLRALLAGIAIGAVAVLGTALPASAHDELLSSTPAANATLDSAPAEVVLTFSGNILPQTALMAITDASGNDYRQGDPKVSETSVTVGLKPGLPGGAYEIRWAVTSEDGHPISGIIPFAIAGSAGATTPAAPTAAPSADSGAGAAETSASTDANAPVATPPASESGASVGPIIALVLTGVAIVALVVIIAVVMARRRGQDGNASTDDSGN